MPAGGSSELPRARQESTPSTASRYAPLLMLLRCVVSIARPKVVKLQRGQQSVYGSERSYFGRFPSCFQTPLAIALGALFERQGDKEEEGTSSRLKSFSRNNFDPDRRNFSRKVQKYKDFEKLLLRYVLANQFTAYVQKYYQIEKLLAEKSSNVTYYVLEKDTCRAVTLDGPDQGFRLLRPKWLQDSRKSSNPAMSVTTLGLAGQSRESLY
ncbi:uncharacterized protein BDR25DRAFT_351930 [Lindgomyces ingoldianus]|uniref:Uncharacterized protein n=1 Tax=Lindgomyces ingoldianus TaxID=673940 RepID=A0ACB6R781_9PLEO|nr:uncharacterized protein BDR25DRAFT_351930 [Lindgomyces ingoldianus]KAF2474387.1 hypothetical protein BDR25DRAFT_351930 [Lindgomyces ingoldianus]